MTASLPAIYTPPCRWRVLRVLGLGVVEFDALVVTAVAGAACLLAARARLHHTAGALASVADWAFDVADRAGSRIAELGSLTPHPALRTLYRWLGGALLDQKIAAMVENDDPEYPGPMLTPAELADFEAAHPGAPAGDGPGVCISRDSDPGTAERVTDEQVDQVEADLVDRINRLLAQNAELFRADRYIGEQLLTDVLAAENVADWPAETKAVTAKAFAEGLDPEGRSRG